MILSLQGLRRLNKICDRVLADPISAIAPEETILAPGVRRLADLTERVEKGFSVSHPGDVQQLPDGIGERVSRGMQGQLNREGLRDIIPDFDDFDEAVSDPAFLTPEPRASWLRKHGVQLGRPGIVPCKACGWQHEQDDCCTWCGLRKKEGESKFVALKGGVA